jgi:hypothetical protein
VLQHRKDTLLVDGRTFIGVAVPTQVRAVNGDVTHDGMITTADIIALVNTVLRNKPAPTGDTLLFQVKKDTTHYIFIRTDGKNR